MYWRTIQILNEKDVYKKQFDLERLSIKGLSCNKFNARTKCFIKSKKSS